MVYQYYLYKMIKKILSGLVTYYAIFLNVVFALDLGYIKYKSSKIRNMIRFWLLLQSLALIAYCMINDYSALKNQAILYFWGIGYCFYYFCVVLISLFSKNISFRKLSADLKDALGIQDDNLEVKMAVIILLTFAYRIADLYYLHVNETRSGRSAALYIFCGFTLCVDMVLLNCTFLFYAPLCRLKHLAETLKTGNVNYRTGQLIYKSIVDVTEKYKDAITLLFLIRYFCTTLESLAIMSEVLFGLLKSANKLHIARLGSYVAVNLIMSLAPALTAGLMTSQASKIKRILIDKLMEEIDPMREQAIDRFIGYIEARPLRLRMWRVFPLDTDLIVAMLQFTVQQVIVIVQFKH